MQHHQRNPLAAVQAKIWGPGASQDFVLTLAAEQQQRRAGTEDELASIAADSTTRSILLRHRCRLKFLDEDTGDLGRRHHGGFGGVGAGRKSTALSSFSMCHRRVRISGPDHAAIRRCCTLLAVRFPVFANRIPVVRAAATATATSATAVVRDVRASQQQMLLRWDETRRKLKPIHESQASDSCPTDAYGSFPAPCQPMPVSKQQVELEGFIWDKNCRFYKPVPNTVATLTANSTATKTQQCHRELRHNYWGSGDDNYSAFFTASHDSNLNDMMLHNGNSLSEREDASSAKSSVTCARFTISLSGDSSKVDRSKTERCKRDAETPRCNRTVTEGDSNKKNPRRKATMDISIQTGIGSHHKLSYSNDLHVAADAAMKPADSDKATKLTLTSSKTAYADVAILCSGQPKRESEFCQDSLKVGISKAEKCTRDTDCSRRDQTSGSSQRTPRRRATMDMSIQTGNRSCSHGLPTAVPSTMKPAVSYRATKFTPTSGNNTTCGADAGTLCLRREKQDTMLGEAAVHPLVATNAANFNTNPRKSGSAGGWFRGKLVHKRITWFLRTAPVRRTRPTRPTRPILARF